MVVASAAAAAVYFKVPGAQHHSKGAVATQDEGDRVGRVDRQGGAGGWLRETRRVGQGGVC